PEPEPEETGSSTDWDAELARTKQAAAALRSNVPDGAAFKCVIVDKKRSRAIGYLQDRIAIYDYANNKIVSDKRGRLLSLDDEVCSEDGYDGSNFEIIALADRVEARCD